MKFTKEQKEEIYNKYMRKINEIADECDWKTNFAPKEIIEILLNIIETEYDQ